MTVPDHVPTKKQVSKSELVYTRATMETIPIDVTFTASNSQPMLIIKADGKLEIGPGLSQDEATQQTAKMLAEHYGFAVTAEIERLRTRCVALENQVVKDGKEIERLQTAPLLKRPTAFIIRYANGEYDLTCKEELAAKWADQNNVPYSGLYERTGSE
jgi:hypothetical protein